MYYDKKAKKLYVNMEELIKDHPFLKTPGTQSNAEAYMFRSDIEQMKPIGPDVAPDYSIYTLVPSQISIEDNTVQMVVAVRNDVTPDKLREVLWKKAKAQLDSIYAKYTASTPTVEQASWAIQQTEAQWLKQHFDTDTMPEVATPVLSMMVAKRKVPGETVKDLAKLVLAAADRYSVLAADLVGQWQRVDRALRAATTVEELVAVDTAIIDPAEKKM